MSDLPLPSAFETDADARLVNVAVVARRLKVTSTTVRNWINSGKLRAGRTPSGRYRVPISELARIIKAVEVAHPGRVGVLEIGR